MLMFYDNQAGKVRNHISQYRQDENERIRQSAIQVRACT